MIRESRTCIRKRGWGAQQRLPCKSIVPRQTHNTTYPILLKGEAAAHALPKKMGRNNSPTTLTMMEKLSSCTIFLPPSLQQYSIKEERQEEAISARLASTCKCALADFEWNCTHPYLQKPALLNDIISEGKKGHPFCKYCTRPW